jgi:hypothetical protein
MGYYTERHGGGKPRVGETITEGVADGIVALIEARITDCSFGYSYPYTCWEYDTAVVGTDTAALKKALTGYFPGLSVGPSENANIDIASDQLVGNFVALDLNRIHLRQDRPTFSSWRQREP